MDALQPAGSFKIRGIGLKCQRAYNKGVRHFIAPSGGNAGLAVAYAGYQLGAKVTVVVPQTTKLSMRQKIAFYGAKIIVHGSCWDEAFLYALTLVDSPLEELIHPFDHPDLWEGHASIIDEVIPLMPKPDLVILATGGGGLYCGVAQGLEKHNWVDVPILSVEPFGAPKFHDSLKENRLITLDKVATVATSLATKTVTSEALIWAQKHPTIPWLVSDDAALNACYQFADDHKILVEPSCGAALSTIYDQASPVKNRNTILVIVCGGNMIDIDLLFRWNQKRLAGPNTPHLNLSPSL